MSIEFCFVMLCGDMDWFCGYLYKTSMILYAPWEPWFFPLRKRLEMGLEMGRRDRLIGGLRRFFRNLAANRTLPGYGTYPYYSITLHWLSCNWMWLYYSRWFAHMNLNDLSVPANLAIPPLRNDAMFGNFPAIFVGFIRVAPLWSIGEW
jgi:hypothetical protein